MDARYLGLVLLRGDMHCNKFQKEYVAVPAQRKASQQEPKPPIYSHVIST